ncbi:MAG TPA: hypothetical protein VD864_11580 [Nocardioides sp.]|nr:hypothetical protein [Nocardioides sp.]
MGDNTQPVSRREVFDHVVAGVRAGDLPVPRSVDFVDRRSMTQPQLTVWTDDLAGARRWATHLGLPEPHDGGEVSNVPPTRAYTSSGPSDRIPGWRASVTCWVRS